jgi:hypothetical protein
VPTAEQRRTGRHRAERQTTEAVNDTLRVSEGRCLAVFAVSGEDDPRLSAERVRGAARPVGNSEQTLVCSGSPAGPATPGAAPCCVVGTVNVFIQSRKLLVLAVQVINKSSCTPVAGHLTAPGDCCAGTPEVAYAGTEMGLVVAVYNVYS